jgi:hypothetical protein
MAKQFFSWCFVSFLLILPHVTWAGEDDLCLEDGKEKEIQKFADRFRQIEETNKCKGQLITVIEPDKSYQARCINSLDKNTPSLRVVSKRNAEIVFSCAGPVGDKTRLYRCKNSADSIAVSTISRGEMTTAAVWCVAK